MKVFCFVGDISAYVDFLCFDLRRGVVLWLLGLGLVTLGFRLYYLIGFELIELRLWC